MFAAESWEFEVDEEELEGKPVTKEGYLKDNFVVSDNDESDDDYNLDEDEDEDEDSSEEYDLELQEEEYEL